MRALEEQMKARKEMGYDLLVPKCAMAKHETSVRVESIMVKLTREALKGLKQDGSVREYVREFTLVMLDVQNMSEDDKLFNLISDLQGWAQMELQRQNVKDNPSVITAADALVDLQLPPPTRPSGEGNKNGGNWDGKEKGVVKVGESSQYRKKQSKVKVTCFICDGSHYTREYRKKKKGEEHINSIVMKDKGGSDEDDSGEGTINNIIYINAMGLVEEDRSISKLDRQRRWYVAEVPMKEKACSSLQKSAKECSREPLVEECPQIISTRASNSSSGSGLLDT